MKLLEVRTLTMEEALDVVLFGDLGTGKNSERYFVEAVRGIDREEELRSVAVEIRDRRTFTGSLTQYRLEEKDAKDWALRWIDRLVRALDGGRASE